jgi:PAS domain S-box-containing protein
MGFECNSDPISVLIADDDTQICNLAQAILAREGYFTLIACDGQQALEASRNHPGLLHLLVSDVKMPRLSGPELCQRIKQERPEISCLLMSGDISGVSMEEGLPFISKPFTPDGLRLKVREVLPSVKPVSQNTDGIWKINADGRTVYANQRMAQMLGTAVEAMLGELSFGFVFPEDVEGAMCLFDTKKRGDSKPFRFRLRRTDGSSVWVSVSNTPMYSNSEFQGILASFSEIESPTLVASVSA